MTGRRRSYPHGDTPHTHGPSSPVLLREYSSITESATQLGRTPKCPPFQSRSYRDRRNPQRPCPGSLEPSGPASTVPGALLPLELQCPLRASLRTPVHCSGRCPHASMHETFISEATPKALLPNKGDTYSFLGFILPAQMSFQKSYPALSL